MVLQLPAASSLALFGTANFHDWTSKMIGTSKDPNRDVSSPLLFRLMVLTLIFVAMPSMAYADVTTQRGLERLANSIGFLAAAVAFAGIVIAMAVYRGLKSRD